MSDDRELVRPDPTASEPVEPPEQPLAEVIAKELSARIAAGDRLETVEDAHGVAESIADAIRDRFVVRPRAAERENRHVARADLGCDPRGQ